MKLTAREVDVLRRIRTLFEVEIHRHYLHLSDSPRVSIRGIRLANEKIAVLTKILKELQDED